jgi:hypothetical protein
MGFEIGDEVLYIWFAGETDEPREEWLVIETGTYSKDVVY